MIILGMFGGPEIIVIVLIVLLLFGGRKIPELAKGLGKGIREFKKATNSDNLTKDFKDIKDEVDKASSDVKESVDAGKMISKPFKK